jgi:hypothetical protein
MTFTPFDFALFTEVKSPLSDQISFDAVGEGIEG